MVSGQITWDETGEAAAALRSAVDSYGPAVLSDACLLGNVLSDLVPEASRERHLLVAAAEQGVAGLLVTQVRDGLSAGAAGRMVAGTLAAEQGVAAAGARWAVAVIASTLGYPTGPLGDDEPPAAKLPPVPRSRPVPTPPPAPSREANLPVVWQQPPPPPPRPWPQPPAWQAPPTYAPPVYQAPVYQPPVYAPPIVYGPRIVVRRRSLLRRIWLLIGIVFGALLLYGMLAGPHSTGGSTTSTSVGAPATAPAGHGALGA